MALPNRLSANTAQARWLNSLRDEVAKNSPKRNDLNLINRTTKGTSIRPNVKGGTGGTSETVWH
jgi:hypothetical protein